jgi:hypothetical protein
MSGRPSSSSRSRSSSSSAKAPSIDAGDVARQARAATGGGRANVSGVLMPDGKLRVVGSSIGDVALSWRRATELARDGEVPLVAEVDTNGNVRVHTNPDGTPPPVDVDLGQGRSA